MDNDGKSSIGIEEGVVAAAAYFCILGPILLLLERRSHFVRFHAVQSVLGYGLITIMWLCVRWIESLSYLAWAPGLTALAFTIYMMYHAYHGDEYKLPVIGNLAFNAVYETEPEIDDSLSVEDKG